MGRTTDVVVVGAGIGGLVAGALLARGGRRVAVVDRHVVAGGNATIFRRKGYEFDVGLHYVGGCHPGGTIPTILRAAGCEELEYEALDPDGFDRLVFPGLRFAVPVGLDRFRQRLLEAFPAERRGIERYLGLMRELQRALAAWTDPLALTAAVARSPRLLRWSRSTLAEFLGACTTDRRLAALLAAHDVGYALPPSRASVLVGLGIVLHYLEGAFYPRGGGQVLADALVDALGRHGGRLLLRTSARRIVVEGGRVAGVELETARGERRFVPAGTVVSGADLKHTLLELVGGEHLPRRIRRRVDRSTMAPPLGVVYLGLRGELSLPRTNYWIHPEWDVEPCYAAAAAGRVHPRPAVFMTVASTKDPSNPRIAPPGITNVQLMSVAPSQPEAWGVSSVDASSGDYRRRPAYAVAKREYAERLLDSAQAVVPDIRERIDRLEVASPLTHTRYTNATGGTSYGLAATPDQFLLGRPAARTDIEGLYLCGASCRSGHGIHGAALSGLFAASAILPGSLRRQVLTARS